MKRARANFHAGCVEHHGAEARADGRLRAHWRANRRLVALMLAIWFAITFGVAFMARPLAAITLFGWPVSFYMAAQGAPILFVILVWVYARRMRKLDEAAGIAEDVA